MKIGTKKRRGRPLAWLVAALVLSVYLPTAVALATDTPTQADSATEESSLEEFAEDTLSQESQDAIDITAFSLEITAQGVSYALFNGAEDYALCMDGEEGGYLYGFYRQNLDWSGQTGVCLDLSNESAADLRLVLMLVDASWQSIEIPDGTPVFLKETGADDVVVIFSDDSTVTVPAGFVGQVQVPLIADDAILSTLEGLGFTFIPSGGSMLTLYDITFWSDATTAHHQSLGTLRVGLAEASLTIPQTGYSMTSITVQGADATDEITYAIADAAAGVTVDEAGRVWVDATASTGSVMVQAIINEQYVLGTPLTLTSVWDVKPEDMTLAEFTILTPPGNAQPVYVQVFLWWTERLTLLRVICILLGLALPCIYLWWRIEAKKDANR